MFTNGTCIPDRTPASASTNYAAAVIEYLEQRGQDPVELFGREVIRRIHQGHAHARMPVAQWKAMLLKACWCLNDPALPLKLASTIKPRHLGMLGYLLMSCDTLASAALALQRYESLLDDVNEARFSVEEQQAIMDWLPLIADPPPEFIMLSMSLWVHYARWLTESPQLTCDARFSFSEPSDPRVRSCFDATFGGRVSFEQGTNQLRFPLAYLNLPVAQRDSHVHESLRRRADIDLQRVDGKEGDFMAHLEAVIADSLESGDISLMGMSSALQMSPRTLQNRLELQGITYRQLLDRVRKQQAELHLRNPTMTLLDVTVVLGFTHQSAFQHAFKRWTGSSPGSYRRRLF